MAVFARNFNSFPQSPRLAQVRPSNLGSSGRAIKISAEKLLDDFPHAANHTIAS
jgi:hypothetical protein